MTESSKNGPIVKSGRVIALGTSLLWVVLAAVGGFILWGVYGNDIRSTLRLPPAGAPAHWIGTQTNQPQFPATADFNELMGLVKDLQASDQHTADGVQTALQLLTSGQATTKTLSDAVAALQIRVDALIQRPVVPAAKNPALVAARKPPVAPSRLSAARPESVQPELEPPPGAPVRLIPR
jgi:hypothetical protein